ncbi:DUF2617 family protein [Halorussus sp. MSC15.2]|uniref:DUF2617 family protein n=1 Tax=Halorussus sp. MSC15.2 TaxID=2283638 RepID=UPI0013D1A614|nr:DUF2617 family protein [Halorussus sp. MSC15.2]NEU58126.1 DUF2617 family protein [Halorussus sp. MSC15.2]
MSSTETRRLHFAYAASEPNLAAFDVKRVVPSQLLGAPAALTVIGASHYVGVPELNFHEVCSCEPISGESTAETPLRRGVEREFAFENDRVRVETSAEVRPIDAFPGSEAADAAFRFGPDAWTTIELAASDDSERSSASESAAYETYHTYPEHGLAVYTETTLRRTRASTDPQKQQQSRTAEQTDDSTDAVRTTGDRPIPGDSR